MLFKRKKGLMPIGVLLVVVLVVFLILGIRGGLLSFVDCNFFCVPLNSQITMTLPDGHQVSVQWGGGGSVGINGNTVTVISQWKPTQTAGAKITILNSLAGVQKVKLMQTADISLGTNNFPSLARLVIGIEGPNEVALLNRGTGSGYVYATVSGGGGFLKDGLGDVELLIPENARTAQHQLVVWLGSEAKTDSSAVITYELKGYTISTSLLPPSIPQPSLFQTTLAKIQDWFKRFFDSIALEISGPQEFTLPDAGVGLAANTLASYEVSIKAPTVVDDNFEDGTFAVRYCSAGFVRKDGTIFNSTVPERCFNEWNQTLTFMVPSRVDQFAVVAVMTENVGVYDSDKRMWVWTGEQVLVKEALNVKTKAPMPQPPSAGFFANLIQSFLDFIKRIFG